MKEKENLFQIQHFEKKFRFRYEVMMGINRSENFLVHTKITQIPVISLDFGFLETWCKIDMHTKYFPWPLCFLISMLLGIYKYLTLIWHG